MVRYRRSTNEWCLDYDAFKAADPGHIWATITGVRYHKPKREKHIEATRKGMIR
jgi:hypothetical protein